jgi:hypothetical protein
MARGGSHEKIGPRRAWGKEDPPTQEVPEVVSSVR